MGLWAGGNCRSSFIGGEEEGLEGQGCYGQAVCLEGMVPWSLLTFPNPKAVSIDRV